VRFGCQENLYQENKKLRAVRRLDQGSSRFAEQPEDLFRLCPVGSASQQLTESAKAAGAMRQ
jgi:hypothetical protein